MLLSLHTAPAETPVSLEEAKAHLRVEHDEEDDLITALINAATAEIDGRQGFLRRSLVTQTWDYFLSWFPVQARICLPFPPVQSVTHIKYFDGANAEQTFDPASYEVVTVAEQAYVQLAHNASWPGTYEREQAINIRYVAGYGDPEDVPANIRAAILIRVGELYANRGDADWSGDMSKPVRRLLAPSRRIELA
jgi:uncharacterized phiE125 gp8 family phage protein